VGWWAGDGGSGGRRKAWPHPCGGLRAFQRKVIKRSLHKPVVRDLWLAYLPRIAAEAGLGQIGAPHVEQAGFT